MDHSDPSGLLGTSPAMRRVLDMLAQVAPTDTTVRIEGETGSGKTRVAAALHARSRRADRPLVTVDCGALPSRMAESVLFGHEAGAFEGATEARAGAFEAADGGTLLLDEIGELPLDLQPKLLRALGKRVVLRIGSDVPIAVNVRVVASSTRRLRREVAGGRFRADLFYRLDVVTLRVPSLAERPEDIPLLAAHFFAQLAGAQAPMPPALLELLGRRDWPGNVLELRNAVERVLVLDGIADDVEPSHSAHTFRAAKDAVIGRWEESYVRALLDLSGGNVSAAARTACLDRSYLREIMRRHGIDAATE